MKKNQKSFSLLEIILSLSVELLLFAIIININKTEQLTINSTSANPLSFSIESPSLMIIVILIIEYSQKIISYFEYRSVTFNFDQRVLF
jgi:DNA polymerase III delta prime subunit